MIGIPKGSGKYQYAEISSPGLKGKASDYIKHISALKPGDRVVLLIRVSTIQQGKKGNLNAQEVKLREAVKHHRGIVVDTVPYEWSGHGEEWMECLWEAANVARKHGAILLAATPDRFIRSEWFRSDKKRYRGAQARVCDLWELERATDGVVLMTYLDPDATPEECHSLLIQWGQEVKGNPWGQTGQPEGAVPSVVPAPRPKAEATGPQPPEDRSRGDQEVQEEDHPLGDCQVAQGQQGRVVNFQVATRGARSPIPLQVFQGF